MRDRFAVVLVLFVALFVAAGTQWVLLKFSSPAPVERPLPVSQARTEFVLGQWYCCLLDKHPRSVGDPTVVGGFGGRTGRPVLE